MVSSYAKIQYTFWFAKFYPFQRDYINVIPVLPELADWNASHEIDTGGSNFSFPAKKRTAKIQTQFKLQKKLAKLMMRNFPLLFMLLLSTLVEGQPSNLRTNNDKQYNDSTAKFTIDSLYGLLKNGHSFRNLAIKYSQDASSYKQGGELDFTPIDNYVSEYRETVLKLTANEISKPFKTLFGYHIAQVIDRKDALYSTKHILIRVSKKQEYHSVVSDKLSANDLNLIKTVDSSSGYNSFYKKYVVANGIPILSSQSVSNQALIQAKAIVEQMASGLPPEVVKTMLNRGFKIVVKAESEKSTDVPEHIDLYRTNSKENWNEIRGLGATPNRPVCSCSEENLLCYETDLYKGHDVLAHEFAHGIHMMGYRFYDKHFDRQIRKMWGLAKKEKLWTGTYALTNIEEYFAYGTQIWFHVISQSPIANGHTNHVDTREELLTYDPRLYKLMKEVFPTGILEVSCNCKK